MNKITTFHFRYQSPEGNDMVFCCRVQCGPRVTMSDIKESVRAKLTQLNGTAPEGLELVSMNDPAITALLEAQTGEGA